MNAPSKYSSCLGLPILTIAFLMGSSGPGFVSAGVFNVELKQRVKMPDKENQTTVKLEKETWDSTKTAVIVCDMWDLHHCRNAVIRVREMAPRIDKVLKKARAQGALIIHAPSSCMDAYQDHPARNRAVSAPKAGNLPTGISEWCNQIPSEEKSVYPLDQSDGGEDDDPKEHEEWAKWLVSQGRNPGSPWKSQIDVLEIKDVDAITDSGEETWNLLEQHGIDNVILLGVHTNMCVLGRPFGLRQLSKNGKNVVLMRDMTDSMYNPGSWPFVSHYEGTSRIIEHIEKYVCPTITSEQLIGGKPFQFEKDPRK
ncbi:MAG TPA: isochorismatase family protein [Verrucomicrobiales bacterium]|nr:isochorismatase family protein [Verrucomicrobiales bacterium]HIL68622.1 isochorismatase family protein [Verrucomicrobiota bacterium]